MKKLLLLLLFPMALSAQQDDKPGLKIRNNEIIINVGMFIGYYDLTYARVLNDESTLGITFSTKRDPSDGTVYNYFITPAYRLFFGKKRAAGFFFEGNVSIYHATREIRVNNRNEEVDKMGVGTGIAIGTKFISKGGLMFELFAGGGRNYLNTEVALRYYPRFGITMGYRF